MNLEEIARLSGVSRSTVSRVINHSPKVSPEIRERVMDVLRQTNFQPNIAARSLAAASTHIIGLVIPTGVSRLFVDPYFPLLIQGISSTCNVNELTLMMWLAEPENESRMIRQILYSGLIDGVVISSVLNTDPLVDALIEANRPFVMVGRTLNNKPVSYVDVDNVESARQATLYLSQQNRKRIATITGPGNTMVGIERLQGYELALKQLGRNLDPDLIAEGNFSLESGYQAMKRLLNYHPDAVFISSDAMAEGAMNAILEAGYCVPQDIALVGFDDIPFAKYTNPPLSTVRQPIQRMGSMAVEVLLDIINDPSSQPRCVNLPTELVIRGSSELIVPVTPG